MAEMNVSGWPTGDVLGLRPELSGQLVQLIDRAAERLPGRLEVLMSARVEQLRGREPADAAMADLVRRSSDHPALSDAERAVLSLTEQFVIDVRGIADDGFEALKTHYSTDELSAITFRLALLEGMSKFVTLFPGGSL